MISLLLRPCQPKLSEAELKSKPYEGLTYNYDTRTGNSETQNIWYH
jgi:hypothetical protein